MREALKRTLAAVAVCIAAAVDGEHDAAAATTAANAATAHKPANGMTAAKPVTPASASTAAALPGVERLKAMVPARIGRWKRVAAPAAVNAQDDPSAPGVQAEFTAGRKHIALEVSKSASAPTAPSDLPRLTRNEAGHELVYREGREIVFERVRRSDGQAQVTLRRDDGLTVVAEGTGIAPERLKAVARAVVRRG